MKKLIISLLIFITSIYSTILRVEDVMYTGGNKEIILATSDSPTPKFATYEYADSNYYLLKKAEVEYYNHNYSKAILLLHDITQSSSKYAPFAYRRIGDIKLKLGDISSAVVAYKTAAMVTDIKPYSFFLNELADSIGKANIDILHSNGWQLLLFPNITFTSTKDTIFDTLTNRLKRGVTETQLDSILRIADSIGGNSYKTKVLKKFTDTSYAKLPFSIKRRYEISKFFNSIKYYNTASRWLNFALHSNNGEIKESDYLLFRSKLNYSLKNWSNVIKYSKEYFKKYGYRADLIYNTARAYKRLNNLNDANYWYSFYVKRYPKSNKSHDILWYQAWQYEDRGSFDTAIVKFRELSQLFPNKKRGDDALLRVGLLYYRKGVYDSASQTFGQFKKKFKKSGLLPAAYYWESRSQYAQEDTLNGKQLLDTLFHKWPINYYSWRGRELLGINDSFTISSTNFDEWYSKLLSISHEINDTLSGINLEENFTLAVELGTIGFKDAAIILAEPLEIRSAKNYAQLYELSKFYHLIGDEYHAFKLIKKIYYSLPLSMRKSLPKEYLEQLYPKAYPREVTIASKEFNVEEALIRGIMRQESMFSHTIRSYVGATGLMQIMNYTGKEIAKDLSMDYDDSMLLDAQMNIYFGTYYISKLLKQFDNNKICAIASYNGGPHNVKKWIERSKDVFDDDAYFTECIGFSETRNYVKRVLENYWIYKKLEEQEE